MVDEFYVTHIDQDSQNDPSWIKKEGENPKKFKYRNANHKILLLKNNQIPKGIIPLERLFNQNDIPLKSTLQSQLEKVEYCNVGSKENPKLVKLSKYIPTELKRKYVELLKEYKDVFALSYEYLKTYDTSFIELKIQLILGVKPFKKNLRQINTILFLVIERRVKNLLDAKMIVPLR
jgi:hypothetical protein